MAVKIVRHPNKIALIGAPSSAAAFAPGGEKAPAALRAAGLVEKLRTAGYEVTDLGDCAPRLFADDDEHKRARNLPAIVASLNELKPRAEAAVKSGALVLVLGGDCSQIIGLITGARRYYKAVNLIWFDRDADLNTPASTPSGRIDGMVLAGIIGRGSPELVRFWGEPPLVREPDTVIFGLERIDPPEQEFLTRSPMRYVYAVEIQRRGAEKSAQDTLAQLHADSREFALHIDLDVIAQDDLSATNVPGSAGLSIHETQSALTQFLSHKNLLGFDVAQYNPEKDLDGSAARKVVDLLVTALSARLNALGGSSGTPVEAAATAAAPKEAPVENSNPEPAPAERSDEPSSSESKSPEKRQGEESHGEGRDEDSGLRDPAAEI